MLINKMSNGIPVRVFKRPIMTVRDPIRQFTGLIIIILPAKKLFFGLIVEFSMSKLMKICYILIISIQSNFK